MEVNSLPAATYVPKINTFVSIVAKLEKNKNNE